jgi:hypothetical protein
MRKLLKLLIYPWEIRKKRKKKLSNLLKEAKLKIIKIKDTSIVLGCLKMGLADDGKYIIKDEYGNILHKGLTEKEAAEQLAKYKKAAKAEGKTLEDYIYDIAYNIKGYSVKISAKAKKGLNDLVKKTWDEILLLSKKKHKGAVSILEHPKYGIINGKSIKGIVRGEFPSGLHPLLDDWVRTVYKKMNDGIIPRNWQHGKCAEVDAISSLLWKIDPTGKAGIDKIRKILEGTVSKAADLNKQRSLHGAFKPACKSCNPLLRYFNIIQDINKI